MGRGLVRRHGFDRRTRGGSLADLRRRRSSLVWAWVATLPDVFQGVARDSVHYHAPANLQRRLCQLSYAHRTASLSDSNTEAGNNAGTVRISSANGVSASRSHTRWLRTA